MGAGVLDQLLITNQTRRKVIGINNASRGIDNQEKRKKLIKEDLYNNLLRLMERGEIQLLDDDELKASLSCICAEHNVETGRLKIWGKDTHIAEGLIRAAWAAKDKTLNIYMY